MPKGITIAVAGLALLLGIVSMVTPIPGGSFLIAIGLTLLICTSDRFANAVARARSRISWFNNAMRWLERNTGRRIGEALSRTRPKP